MLIHKDLCHIKFQNCNIPEIQKFRKIRKNPKKSKRIQKIQKILKNRKESKKIKEIQKNIKIQGKKTKENKKDPRKSFFLKNI